MRKNQLVFLAGLVVVIAGIFYFGRTSLNSAEASAERKGFLGSVEAVFVSGKSGMANTIAAFRRRAVGHPATAYYLDRDGDGYGDPKAKQNSTTTTSGASVVMKGTDCDDTNPEIYQLVSGIGQDRDRDWYIDLVRKPQCVGDGPIGILNESWYVDAKGQATWLELRTAKGQDCDDGSAKVFQAVANLVPDCNVNGLPDDRKGTKMCVGKAQKTSATYDEGGATRARTFEVYRDAKDKPWIANQGKTDTSSRACPRI